MISERYSAAYSSLFANRIHQIEFHRSQFTFPSSHKSHFLIDVSKRFLTDHKSDFNKQVLFNHLNSIIDRGKIGDKIDSEYSLREEFHTAQRTIFIPHVDKLGDAVLFTSAINAVIQYNIHHPENPKSIDILTTFPILFEGLKEKHPDWITVIDLKNDKHKTYADVISDYVNEQEGKSFIIGGTSATQKIYETLQEKSHDHITAITDARITRIAHYVPPWKMTTPPYNFISSYPARMFRFMEIVLGEKLTLNPAKQKVDIILPSRIEHKFNEMRDKFHRHSYHCIIPSASKPSKRFHLSQLTEIVTEVATHSHQETRDAHSEKVLLIQDPNLLSHERFDPSVLPQHLQEKIESISGDLETLLMLFSMPYITSVIGLDSGISHIASAMGKKTLLVSAVANPHLWQTGQRNTSIIATAQSIETLIQHHVINDKANQHHESLIHHSLSTNQIINFWKEMLKNNSKERKHAYSHKSVSNYSVWQQSESSRIHEETSIEREWWPTEERYFLKEAAEQSGNMIVVPQMGENYRLISNLNGNREPNILRAGAFLYMEHLLYEWRKHLSNRYKNIKLAITSLYRDSILQDFLLNKDEGFNAVGITESTHLAGSAFDISINSYYHMDEEGYAHGVQQNKPDSGFFYSGFFHVLHDILVEHAEQGKINFVVENRIVNGKQIPSVIHVCINPDEENKWKSNDKYGALAS